MGSCLRRNDGRTIFLLKFRLEGNNRRKPAYGVPANRNMDDLLPRLANWSDPWFWVCLAAVIYTNTVIGFLPLTSERELTAAEHLLMHARRILLLLFLMLFPGFPLVLWFLAAGVTGDIAAAGNVVKHSRHQPGRQDVGAGCGGTAWRRAHPGHLPALPVPALLVLVHVQAGIATRQPGLRYTQRGQPVPEKTVPPREILPGREHMFMGLRQDNTPLYVAADDWKLWNQRMVGATQSGKGILFGVQLDQSVRQGFCTVFFDVKPDRHALGIMRKACEDTGRRLVTVDFNGELPGKWSPFRTGTDREVKTRLMHAYNLSERGDTADFYKIGEREFLEVGIRQVEQGTGRFAETAEGRG